MTDSKTDTERLREMLDKRGVEYEESTQGNTTFFQFDYCEQCGGNMKSIVITGECISAYSDYLTLEQAIAATLGSGECEITASATDGLCSDNPRIWFKLSCGHSFTLDGLEAPNYCPNCGKAVNK